MVFSPKTLTLGRDEVHVWLASLDATAYNLQSLQPTLSTDEQQRAERFYFQKDRDRFIIARGLLRTILGRYLNIEPENLRFGYGAKGKPFLTQENRENPLRFNLSHSHELALYAITQNRHIGVDIERIRTELPCEEIAERFFSAFENDALRTVSQNMKHKAFFNCWTRKEAYIKATGKGLSLPLNQFDVTLAPGEPAMLLNTKWNPEEASRWSLRELVIAPDYVAALAVEGNGWQLKKFKFS